MKTGLAEEKMEVPEKSIFETVRLIFKGITIIICKLSRNCLKIVAKRDYIRTILLRVDEKAFSDRQTQRGHVSLSLLLVLKLPVRQTFWVSLAFKNVGFCDSLRKSPGILVADTSGLLHCECLHKSPGILVLIFLLHYTVTE